MTFRGATTPDRLVATPYFWLIVGSGVCGSGGNAGVGRIFRVVPPPPSFLFPHCYGSPLSNLIDLPTHHDFPQSAADLGTVITVGDEVSAPVRAFFENLLTEGKWRLFSLCVSVCVSVSVCLCACVSP